MIRKNALAAGISLGLRGPCSWGTNSLARTIGPATRCGKKAS